MRTRFALVIALALAGATRGSADAFVWPSAPGKIEKSLDSKDPVERIAAARQIAELEVTVADPLLRKALTDGDVDIKLAAAQSAVDLRSRKAAETVVGWLTDPNSRVRLMACEVIRAAPVPAALRSLTRVLADPDASVRSAAAAALGASGTSEVAAALLGHLDDPAPQMRADVADALARIGDPVAAVPLLSKVTDPAPEVRRAVARALGELGDARAASALVLAIRDPAPAVRIEAVTALGRLRATEAVLAITPLLDEREPAEVRASALAALGQIRSDAAVALLVKALATDDPNSDASPVRLALCTAGKAAVAPLLQSLTSYGPSVAANSALALGAMHEPSAGPLIVDAVRRGSVGAEAGLRALALLGDPETIPAVLEMLGDPHRTVRRRAVSALEALLDPKRRDGRAVEPLSAALKQKGITAEERESLVRVIGRTGAPRALSILTPLARSPSGPLKLAALEAIGMLGPAGQDAVLLEAIGDDDPVVRTRAALSLSLSAASSTVSVLLTRLVDAPAEDRVAVGVALSGALARTNDPALVEAVEALLARVGDRERDALIEGLGRIGHPTAGMALARMASSVAESSGRAKVAEALAGHPAQANAILTLLDDRDASVRAHAVWTVGAGAGQWGKTPEARRIWERTVTLTSDPDPDVASNAVAALGLAKSSLTGTASEANWAAAVPTLCHKLRDFRPYVRANALTVLSILRARCPQPYLEHDLLLSDRVELVRRAAARLLTKIRVDASDARVLSRCAATDKSGAVATICRESELPSSAPQPADKSPVVVFVVPNGGTDPLPLAPYALLRSDGLIRSGLADQRGAVFEARCPSGNLRLVVPGSLAW